MTPDPTTLLADLRARVEVLEQECDEWKRIAEQARKERDELEAVVAQSRLCQMLRIEPVRPDIHAAVVRQRDTALREIDWLRSQLDAERRTR